MKKKNKENDPFKGMNLHKDLKDFYYHVSLSSRGDEFFRNFEEEFLDFVKRKSQNSLNTMSSRLEQFRI